MQKRVAVTALAVGIPTLVALLIVVTAVSGSFTRPEAGQIGVVRNGGPLDNRNIRQILPAGSGTTWIGWQSNAHFYPAAFVQRYYTITSDAKRGDRPGVDVVQVQSADGILVGIEGTFYLQTAFDATGSGRKLLQDFDNRFGTREFPVKGSARRARPWQGDPGWGAFLDAIVRPIIENDLRKSIARFRCEELVSSCALVATQGEVAVSAVAGRRANLNLQKVQDDIDSGLAQDIQTTLGEQYFHDIRFRLSRVTLPDKVQAAINDAQAQFALVARARAQVQQAQQQRLAGLKLADLYRRSPALAQIEQIRELAKLPRGSNVYIGIQPIVATPAGR